MPLPGVDPRLARCEIGKALVVTYTNRDRSIQAVKRLRQAYPGTPIFSRATDYEQYLNAQESGATAVVSDLRCDSMFALGNGMKRRGAV